MDVTEDESTPEERFRAMTAAITVRPPIWFYHCEPTWSWFPRAMTDYDLWFVLEGEGELRLNGERFALSAGSTFLFPPGCQPSAIQNPQRRPVIFAAHFDVPPGELRITDLAELPTPGFVQTDPALFVALTRHTVHGWQRRDELGKEQATLAVRQLLLLFWEATRAKPSLENPADAPLLTLAAAIQDEPDRGWTVEVMAAQCFLSRSQFTRRFEAVMGMPPQRFVIETRLAMATQLIQDTELTLAQIADAVGYRDLYFFSRQFKRYRGVPPGSLRRRSRDPETPRPVPR